MISLIIFDLDGTLLNTIDDLGQACNYALTQCGLPTHSMDEYPHLVGNGINRLIERALPPNIATYPTPTVFTHQPTIQDWVQMVRQHFVPYYNTHNRDLTHPYEGISQLLEKLKQKNLQLAVASNKYQQATEQIVQHYFPETFDVILGERENIPRKPDPHIVYDIFRQLGREQEARLSTIYIGDSLVDIQTARNANVPIAACSWGFVPKQELETACPDYLIDAPNQVLDLIV